MFNIQFQLAQDRDKINKVKFKARQKILISLEAFFFCKNMSVFFYALLNGAWKHKSGLFFSTRGLPIGLKKAIFVQEGAI